MGCFIDLRFFLPPLLNSTIFLALFIISKASDSTDYSSWFQDGLGIILNSPLVIIPFFIFFLLSFILLLFTSIKIFLSINHINVRTGVFSGLLLISILLSIIFPPPLFWFAYFFLYILSPWYEQLKSLLHRFFSCLHGHLQSVPTIFITCFTCNPRNRLATYGDDDDNHQADHVAGYLRRLPLLGSEHDQELGNPEAASSEDGLPQGELVQGRSRTRNHLVLGPEPDRVDIVID